MSVRTPNPGFKVTTRSGTVTLVIPQAHPGLMGVFSGLSGMMLWLIAATLAGSSASDNSPQIPNTLIYLGAIGFPLITIAILRDKVTVTLTPTELAVSRKFLGIPGKDRFNLKDVRHLHVYGPTRNNRRSVGFKVLFYYGQDTIVLAKGLTQSKAHLVVEALTQRDLHNS